MIFIQALYYYVYIEKSSIFISISVYRLEYGCGIGGELDNEW